MGRGADCCCHRFPSKTDGIAKNFWSKRAAKRVCRRMPGEITIQKLRLFAPKCSVSPILSLLLNPLNVFFILRGLCFRMPPTIVPICHFSTLVFSQRRRKGGEYRLDRSSVRAKMELLVVIVVVVVASAMIPGSP